MMLRYSSHWLSCVFVLRICKLLAADSIVLVDLMNEDNHVVTRLFRSNASLNLNIPRTKYKTDGDRAYPVAAATLWNRLPFVTHQALIFVNLD